MDEIVFGESPRWHDGRLWFSDWGAGRIWSVTAGAEPVLEAEVEQLMCIDFLPDGRLLVVSPADGGVLLRREPDGTLVTHADLSAITRSRLERHRGRRPGPRLREQHRVRLPRWRVRAGAGRPRRHRRLDAGGRRGAGLPQRHGHQPGRLHPRGRGVVRREADGVPDRRRRHPRRARVPGRRRRATTPTASASTPPARSGTPTSATSTASGCARAARCSTPSTPTAARSRARCRGRQGDDSRCCWSSARSGARTRGADRPPGSWWPSRLPSPATAGRDRLRWFRDRTSSFLNQRGPA